MTTAATEAMVEGADLLLTKCGRLRSHERITIVCDATTRAQGQLLESRAKRISSNVTLVEVPTLSMHGQEPPAAAAEAMFGSDLCVGITAKSMAHSRARQRACANGSRYLSLPDYSMELFSDPSLRADYEARAVLARFVADAFTVGSHVEVKTDAGTSITMSAAGRVGNCCPGYVQGPGELGSPPDIEANVSPIETSAEGIVVVDGSIPYPTLGLLKSPITLTVTGGRIVRMDGDPVVVAELRRLFESAGSPRAYVLAECGVGLNDMASLTGVMLTDEGAAGTMHFGFGSNSTVGGLNEVPFHLDFVFKNPVLKVDGVTLLERGAFKQPAPPKGVAR